MVFFAYSDPPNCWSLLLTVHSLVCSAQGWVAIAVGCGIHSPLVFLGLSGFSVFLSYSDAVLGIFLVSSGLLIAAGFRLSLGGELARRDWHGHNETPPSQEIDMKRRTMDEKDDDIGGGGGGGGGGRGGGGGGGEEEEEERTRREMRMRRRREKLLAGNFVDTEHRKHQEDGERDMLALRNMGKEPRTHTHTSRTSMARFESNCLKYHDS